LRCIHFGKVPALRNGDLTIFETAAIMRYVDEAFDGPQLQPPDPESRVQIEQWLSLINDNFTTL
jgi:glutathione S-transferase